MFHYTKSFGLFARDYGIQEGSGLPELHEGIVPVALVDDTTAYVERTYAMFAAWGLQAGVAAVYGLSGVFNPGPNAIRVDFAQPTNVGATPVYVRVGIADLRTANTAAVVPVGLLRGQTAVTGQVLTGTTTVASPAAGSALIYDANDLHQLGQAFWPIYLRPGEYLWFEAFTVNVSFTGSFIFSELQFTLPMNPPNLNPGPP